MTTAVVGNLNHSIYQYMYNVHNFGLVTLAMPLAQGMVAIQHVQTHGDRGRWIGLDNLLSIMWTLAELSLAVFGLS